MIGENEYFTDEKGNKIKFSVLKAQAASHIVAQQRNFLKNLSPEKKAKFYYHVYQVLDKQTLADKKDPFLRIGISPYTFMTEPINVGNFVTSHGEIFSRIHQALTEGMATFDFGEK